jgi:fatty-acyl-CoA synthase
MRVDERGYFYFVDRLGETFRWKGENVSASEVAAALCAFPAIADAQVYGVAVPGTDGRAGMAAIVPRGAFDLTTLLAHLLDRLPIYAVPVFLRVRECLELTGTFKHAAGDLARVGYDPTATDDPLYVHDRLRSAFVRLDRQLFAAIHRGEIRL